MAMCPQNSTEFDDSFFEVCVETIVSAARRNPMAWKNTW